MGHTELNNMEHQALKLMGHTELNNMEHQALKLMGYTELNNMEHQALKLMLIVPIPQPNPSVVPMVILGLIVMVELRAIIFPTLEHSM